MEHRVNRTCVALGYLRAAVTLLVVFHHATLAYNPRASRTASFAPGDLGDWVGVPVVDLARWSGFRWAMLFNDQFFMSLMFFLSGLFAWGSLARKGAARFLRDRAMRLGVPFLVCAGIIVPLAYFPSFVQSGGADPMVFALIWLDLPAWPPGPAWFLVVLLAFDVGLAGVYLLRSASDAVWPSHRKIGPRIAERPRGAFLLLLVVSAGVYLPMTLAFDPWHWTMKGPIAVQTARILHYGMYFGAGAALGARHSIGYGWLSVDGRLARDWLLWVLLALGMGVVAVLAVHHVKLGESEWATAANIAFVGSCASSSFGLLAVFLRWVDRRSNALESLRSNAYGIFLLHLVPVTWLQYALVPAPFPAWTKGFVVTVGAIAVSWIATAALRRIPAAARILDNATRTARTT